MGFEHFTFPSGQHRLYGALHRPEGECLGGAVLCAPFAEEQKTSYRVYSLMASRMAARGWSVLHFDYAGTGDSSGNFRHFSLETARQDIAEAINVLRAKTGVSRVGLLGLRLGGSLALELAESRDDIDWLVLWQPIVNGEEFFKLNIKRQLVRKMLMRSASDKRDSNDASPATVGQEEDVIDLDGYPLSKVACEQLREISLPPETPGFAGRKLLVQISTSDRQDAALRSLADAYELDDSSFRIQVAEPVWLRLGVLDSPELIDMTVDWLSAQEKP